MTPLAVGFDLGETLFEYTELPLSWIAAYPAALALVAQACRVELTPLSLHSGRELLLRYNARVTPRPEEREYTAEHIFRELLLTWQLPEAHLSSAISAFFGHFSGRVRAFPESAGVLRYLEERGVPVGILTDVPYGMPVELVHADLTRAGLAPAQEQLLTSALVGHRKPHAAGFRALARRLGLACSELLYVGNERKDVQGAAAAGCRTALIWRAVGQPPEWGQELTLRSLDELRALSYGC